MLATHNLVQLRQLLAERFPHLRQGPPRLASRETCPTGATALDELLGGGLARGEFTELVAPPSSSGSAQVLHAWLHRIAADGQFLALVDGADSFDVGAVEQDVLNHLLWVRCRDAGEALKAADLLLRDRNVPLVALDLKLNSAKQLAKISSSVWFRFARLLEANRTTVLAITPAQIVSGAAWRVRLDSALGLEELQQSPAQVVAQLQFTLLRAAEAGEDEHAAEAS